jgi:hypothetical protein
LFEATESFRKEALRRVGVGCRSRVEAETCLEFREITSLYIGDPTPPGGGLIPTTDSVRLLGFTGVLL